MNRLMISRACLIASALFLGVAGVVQLTQESLAYFFRIGPYVSIFGDSPYTIGFVEAHALAVVLAVVIARGAWNPARSYHVLAAAVHVLLGGANLLFWQAFAAFDMTSAGTLATALHASLTSLHVGAVWIWRSHRVSSVVPLSRSQPQSQPRQHSQWPLDRGSVSDYGFRVTAAVTLVSGMYVHLTHILVGREVFLEYVFTPTLDLLLTVPMTWATLAGLVAWRRASFRSVADRAGYALVVGYFVLSSVVHARALLQGSVEYVEAFPTWYSYPILVVLTGFFLFVRSLQFRSEHPAAPSGSAVPSGCN